jgi:cytosine/adenosine deaminase-related metal-dependent hydrolase
VRSLRPASGVGRFEHRPQADLLMIRASDLNLIGGLHDPIGTVVTAARPGNVDTILVLRARWSSATADSSTPTSRPRSTRFAEALLI